MALYHFHAQAFSRGRGDSAVAAAAYRSGECLEDERTGETHDYSRRQGVEHAEIIAPDQAPEWARDRAQLWNQAEQAERRKDAQVAREVDVALPAELSERERRELVREFVRREFVDRGMVADVAHHSGQGRNPHAHVMLTLRRLEGERFAAAKERTWNDKKMLQGWRETWARDTNRALEHSGHAERVDHQTLRAQRQDALARGDDQAAAKLDREPQVHLGKTLHMEERGIETERGNRYAEIAERNDHTGSLPKQREELTNLQQQIKALELEQQRDDEQKVRDAAIDLALQHHRLQEQLKQRQDQSRDQVDLSR